MDSKQGIRHSLSKYILPALASLPFLCAGATQPVYDLNDFVVVSTRTPLSMDRLLPSVDLITEEEMDRWQDQSLAETLLRTPGMVQWSNGSKGSLTSLSIRGAESNHTSFFLDGRRLNPGFGNQYDLGYLPINNLESVEIQRGASTVNYGSSGIGGVVNARLKPAMGLKASEGSLWGEIGSNDYYKAGGALATGRENLGLTVSASALKTDNERDNDAYEKLNISSRFDWALTDLLYFELLGMAFAAEKELPGSVVNPTPDNEEETTNWLVSPGLRYLSDELSVHFFYARSERVSDIFEVNPAYDYSTWPATFLGNIPISNEIVVTTDEVDLQVDYSLSEAALLTVGGVYRNDNAHNTNISTFSPLSPPDPYEESFQQWGSYALLALQISEAFEVRGGIRYDDYSDYDDELTGNISLIYQLADADAAFFAKLATSYAPPSPVDLAYDSDTSTPLNAEESVSYELGFRQTLMDERLNYSLTLFRNEIDDLLSYEPSTFDTFNIEEAVTQGLEFSVEYEPNDRLMLGLGYTYLVAESDRLNDPRTGGFVADPADDVPLARRPEHLLQLSAFYDFTDEFSAGVQAIGQFEREDIDPVTYLQVPAEDFFVVRLVADWKLSDEWSLYGRVENLLDEDYASAAGYPALGRTGYLGVKYSF